ncbi:MAG: DUF4351 domain-containing protein [Magnetococcales bacterium]|nr:DUF4351 domain-containing protein [Magnetococcales bacterium]
MREDFTARGLRKAKEQLDILRLPEPERKSYEHYKDDLHYQASMVESTYGIGRLEGRQEGRQEGEAALLLRLLKRRFHPLPEWVIQKVSHAEQPTLEVWGDRLLETTMLEEVFLNQNG